MPNPLVRYCLRSVPRAKAGKIIEQPGKVIEQPGAINTIKKLTTVFIRHDTTKRH